MTLLVIYDLALDKERDRLANLCLDFGLARIQYSAFLGDLPTRLKQRFIDELKERSFGDDANIQVFLLEQDWQKRRIILPAKSIVSSVTAN